MQIQWFLESDIYGDDIAELVKEIEAQGHGLKILSDRNHWDTSWLNLYDKKDCVIYYGGLELGYTVRREASWVPGIYSSIENYACTKYYPIFGQYLLNQNYIMIPYGELLRQKDFLYEKVGIDNAVFIRPNKGNKVFTGTLVYKERFERDIDVMGFYETQPDELCVVCEPRNIEHEWRFLIVDNKFVAGSTYGKSQHDVFSNQCTCEDRYAYAVATKVMCNIDYCPDRCWTLDMCMTKENNYYVNEVGCFSCAGLYSMDMSRVVSEVSRAALEDWKEIFG